MRPNGNTRNTCAPAACLLVAWVAAGTAACSPASQETDAAVTGDSAGGLAVTAPGPVGTMTYYPLTADNTTGAEKAWFIDSHPPKPGDWWLVPGYVFEVSPDGTRFVWGAMNDEYQAVFRMSTLAPDGVMSEAWHIDLFGMEQAVFAPDSRALLAKNTITKDWEYFVPGTDAHFLTNIGMPPGTHVPARPVWGPDSRLFLLWAQERVTFHDLDQEVWSLPHGSGDLFKAYVVPSIAPNAEWVALAYYREPAEGQGYERQYLGVQLYHVPSRTFTAAKLGDGPDGLPLGFAASLDPGPVGSELPAPFWTPDSTALVFNRQSQPAALPCSGTADAHITLLDVAKSVTAGKDVTSDLPLGLTVKGDECVAWSVSGALAGPNQLLVTVHSLKAATVEGKQGFLTARVEVRSVDLEQKSVAIVAQLDNECSDGPYGLCAPLTPGDDTVRCTSWRFGDVLLHSGLIVDIDDKRVRKADFPSDLVSPDCSAVAVDSLPLIEVYGFDGKQINATDMSLWADAIKEAEKPDDSGTPTVDYGIRQWR
jgi:hypothetical protein